jgi:hypothetical protein
LITAENKRAVDALPLQTCLSREFRNIELASGLANGLANRLSIRRLKSRVQLPSELRWYDWSV